MIDFDPIFLYQFDGLSNQRRSHNQENLWESDTLENLEFTCSINFSCFNLLSWQVHDDTSCDQHCEWNTNPHINKDNRELSPEMGQSRMEEVH